MLKEIIATVLLTGSLSIRSLVDLPKREVVSSPNSVAFVGSYCMAPTINIPKSVKDVIDTDGDVDFTANYGIGEGVRVFEETTELVGWTFLSAVSVHGYKQNNTYYVGIVVDFPDGETIQTYFPDGYDFGNIFQYSPFKDLIIFYEYTYYYYGDIGAYLLYSILSTKGNQFITSYSGWYTFNQNYVNNTEFEYHGNITGNYSYFNMLHCGSNFIEFTFFSNDIDDNYYTFTMYDSGEWFSQRYVYFEGCLLNPTDVQLLSNIGQFTYVPKVPEYDLGNYLFGIMDAPIYVLYSLLNFELLGFNIFVALTTLLSLVMLLFVIKLIVKFW